MSSNPSAAVSPSKQPTPPAPQGSSARLMVLLGLLAVAIGALGYDLAVAKPGSEEADKKINKYVDENNRKSVKDGKRVTPDEIQKLLGAKPTWTEKHPDDNYEVEYYCWWGQVPVLKLWRHYLTVVYVGDEPRHYTSHYMNDLPPIEALPIQQSPPEVTDEVIPPPTSSAEPKKTSPKEGDPTAAEGKPADAPAAETKEGDKAEGEKK